MVEVACASHVIHPAWFFEPGKHSDSPENLRWVQGSLELVRQLLDPLPGSEVVIAQAARIAMADAIHLVFMIAFVAAALAMITVLFTPHKELTERSPERDPSAVSAD